MKQFLFSTRVPDGREVCIAPVSSDTFEDNGVHALGDDTGYFIYEYDTERPASGIEILAKLASYEAAVRIVDIFLAAQKAASQDRAVGRDAPPQSPLAQPLPAS